MQELEYFIAWRQSQALGTTVVHCWGTFGEGNGDDSRESSRGRTGTSRAVAGQGGGCLAFHWEMAKLSRGQLELGENYLLPGLLPGPRSGEGARAKAAKCQGETSRFPCSADCLSSMISHQHMGPWQSVLCLWESPWLWKMQIDPVVARVYRVVTRTGKHGR